ncbi:GNAT family N-acetyltransferase [Halomonas elongata]|uniref:GNAT family N-acetyltransferase n=1 Tax=Halomonas elongata TaxID=2746 RepID=UPI00335FD93B
MQVRMASKNDLVQVCELIRELGYEAAESDLAMQLDTYVDMQTSALMVTETPAGDLSGLISGHLIPLMHQPGNVGRITAFVVREDHRSTGIGTVLLEALESWFRDRGCFRFEVTSGDHRARAHKFYDSKGYISGGYRYIK